MLTRKEKELLELLAPRAAESGLEVVTVEVAGAKKAPTIRIYLDHPEGVSFDRLTEAQVWINELMDEIDPFPGAYTLEVSSPGIDRPLRTPEHFQRFAGEKAQVKLTSPQDNRSNWTGIIVSADDDEVVLSVDGTDVSLPFSNIKKANLKGTVDFSG